MMQAVAAARQWWAARRSRPRPPRDLPSSEAAGIAVRELSRPLALPLAHGAALALVLLAAAMIACAVIGFSVTHYNDRRFADERHAALATALNELRAVFGDVHRFDYGQLRLIERRTGLKDLRFGSDPDRYSGREIQSLQDPRGRIIGWFSWAPDRALIRDMDWLWGFVGALALALLLCAGLAARSTRRLAQALSRSIATARKLVSEDPLTGLANQRMMRDALDRALARRGGGKVAFALLDLDNFREVNDALGRKGGDDLLHAVAERLKAGLPAGAELGRFEDDEFAAIARGDDADTAIVLGEALRASLSAPFPAGPDAPGQNWQISAGIGIVQAPDDGTRAEDLAQRAALALRAAKREGRAVVRRFEAAVETEHADRRFLLRELKVAISHKTFDVHYQPIVAADGSGTVGVEALLRWSHGIRGGIAPSVFIPLAEQNGLMGELGEIVLRRALSDAKRWPDVFVAVNLSPVQVRDPRFVGLVEAVMAETGMEASRVVLEMTEGVLIDDPDETLSRLEALHALGVSLALDDFGTGYSSLSYLQKFPFQRLKIDRAFVASLGAIGNAGAIIQSIVTLGHALGMSVLAEGIETDEQRVLLRLSGCDEMQGYLFARPSPAAAIDALLAPQTAAPAATERRA
jgi:diguanylate cyclase (GGDEF)-like protein